MRYCRWASRCWAVRGGGGGKRAACSVCKQCKKVFCEESGVILRQATTLSLLSVWLLSCSCAGVLVICSRWAPQLESSSSCKAFALQLAVHQACMTRKYYLTVSTQMHAVDVCTCSLRHAGDCFHKRVWVHLQLQDWNCCSWQPITVPPIMQYTCICCWHFTRPHCIHTHFPYCPCVPIVPPFLRNPH